jgi:hypothetical protein
VYSWGHGISGIIYRMSIKIVTNGKIEVNNVTPILHFLTVLILTVMPEIPCLELYIYTTVQRNRVYCTIPDTESWPTFFLTFLKKMM